MNISSTHAQSSAVRLGVEAKNWQFRVVPNLHHDVIRDFPTPRAPIFFPQLRFSSECSIIFQDLILTLS